MYLPKLFDKPLPRLPIIDQQLPDLPKDVRFCSRCVTSNQRPRISFDENDVCSACQWAEEKETSIDWDERERELRDLLDRYRSRDGSFDILVPSSGGKDSGYVAHILKTQYNMTPLTVTWAPFLYTDIGRVNHNNLVQSGFFNITYTPNGKLHRKFSRIAFECNGDNWDPFTWGQKSVAFYTALQFNIPLIMEGENGEVEYGGTLKYKDVAYEDVNVWKDIHFRGNGPDELARIGLEAGAFRKEELTSGDMFMYKTPDLEPIEKLGVQQHFFSYYTNWIPQENYYYAVENTGFEVNPERSEGTYTKYASLDDQMDGFHFWLGYLKFGMGRSTRDASMEVRCNHLTREEAVVLVKRYDGEFPSKYYPTLLKYLDMPEERFWEIADRLRTPHLWDRVDGEWRLKHRVEHLEG